MNNNENNNERVNCAPIGELLSEGAKGKKRGTSAVAQVTYMSLSKAIKVVNVALERVEDAKYINAPKLREELKVCGFSKFCTDCLPFMWGTHTLVLAPSKGESDFRYIQRVDEKGCPVYSPAELVRAFESKFESALEAEKARKAAERDAKREEREERKAKKAADALAIANEQKREFEKVLGRAVTDAELLAMQAIIAKKA